MVIEDGDGEEEPQEDAVLDDSDEEVLNRDPADRMLFRGYEYQELASPDDVERRRRKIVLGGRPELRGLYPQEQPVKFAFDLENEFGWERQYFENFETAEEEAHELDRDHREATAYLQGIMQNQSEEQRN